MKKIITTIAILIIALHTNLHAQQNTKPVKNYGFPSLDLGFVASTNAKNTNAGRPLFAGNGATAGIGYRWGDRWGVTGKIAYASGKTNEVNVQTFAKTLVSSPFIYKINGWQKQWSQVVIAAGPSFMFGKNKLLGEVFIKGGIVTGNKSELTIDKYDGNIKLSTVYTGVKKSVNPYWEMGASYKVAKISKRIVMSINGGYGSNGGTIGIAFHNMRQCCMDCCRLCPCPPPKPPKGK